MINKELLNIFKGSNRTRVVESIELTHTETGLNLYLCKYPTILDLTTEDDTTHTFIPTNFIVTLPPYQENGHLNINVTFSTVGFSQMKELENILRNSEEKLVIKYRIYTENNFKYPQTQAPFVFTIDAVDIQQRNVSLSGSLLLSVQTAIPNRDYTVESFRGLKYL